MTKNSTESKSDELERRAKDIKARLNQHFADGGVANDSETDALYKEAHGYTEDHESDLEAVEAWAARVFTAKATHTPRPWDVRKIESVTGFRGVFGIVSNGGPVNRSMVAAEESANGRLIKAAPELLAFIESKRHIFQGKTATGKDFADFLAVLSKVEGC